MANKPFTAYEGRDPYFFVSYAHEDAEPVYPEMAWLQPAGFNLWHDDGIHVGTEEAREAVTAGLQELLGLGYWL